MPTKQKLDVPHAETHEQLRHGGCKRDSVPIWCKGEESAENLVFARQNRRSKHLQFFA
jgi:hypothetical protein